MYNNVKLYYDFLKDKIHNVDEAIELAKEIRMNKGEVNISGINFCLSRRFVAGLFDMYLNNKEFDKFSQKFDKYVKSENDEYNDEYYQILFEERM